MNPASGVGLPEALERAATALRADAKDIRPANGDPIQLRRQLGVEAAARVLRWLLENAPIEAEELVEAWTEDSELDPTPVLLVGEDGLSKVAAKILRRARHRLRSRGVKVPEKRPDPVVATLGRAESTFEVAALTSIDPRGSRVAYLVEENPAGGARIFEAVLDEQRGIVAFEVYSAARGKARRFLREITRRDSHRAVEADPTAVRALIARVAGYQPSKRPAPRGFAEWRSRVAVAPEGAPTPGEIARESLGTVTPASGSRVAELIRAGEIGPWPPDNRVLETTAEKIAEIHKGDLVVSTSARREQADGIIDEALPELYAEPFASRCAERFEEMAYVYWKSEREEDARACLAAADSFRAEVDELRPLARAMLEVLLTPVLSQLEDAAIGKETSPIVHP